MFVFTGIVSFKFFSSVWVCVCVHFVMCGCECVHFVMCGCVCVHFVMCGCVCVFLW